MSAFACSDRGVEDESGFSCAMGLNSLGVALPLDRAEVEAVLSNVSFLEDESVLLSGDDFDPISADNCLLFPASETHLGSWNSGDSDCFSSVFIGDLSLADTSCLDVSSALISVLESASAFPSLFLLSLSAFSLVFAFSGSKLSLRSWSSFPV